MFAFPWIHLGNLFHTMAPPAQLLEPQLELKKLSSTAGAENQLS